MRLSLKIDFMMNRDLPGGCPIHGPGHLGQPCPDQITEEPIDPETEYGGIGLLFSAENLRENYDEVASQLEKLKGLIKKQRERDRESQIDPDKGHYVEALDQQIDEAFANFSINKKKMDIRKLALGATAAEQYNDIVLNVNDYVEMHMIGSDKKFLEEI